MKILNILGRAVYDSNGSPAIEVEVQLEDGSTARSIAPRGSTTGIYEACYLEDHNAYLSLDAVTPALKQLETKIVPALVGRKYNDQTFIDEVICSIDSSPQKNQIGGNVSIAVSMAVAKVSAISIKKPLYAYLADDNAVYKIQPMFNIIDGIDKPGNPISGIEFLIIPKSNLSYCESLNLGTTILKETQKLLWNLGESAGYSKQGAIASEFKNCEIGFHYIDQAALKCGYKKGEHYNLGLDMASSDFYNKGSYTYPWLNAQQSNSEELLSLYVKWINEFGVVFLEDGFSEQNEESWKKLMALSSNKDTLIAGDDLFASNSERIKYGYEQKLANACLIKPNQIGTITETLDAMKTAKSNDFKIIVSQRSGENDDSLITHLAIAGKATYLKAGGMSRMDRIIKFNELLRIV